MKRAGTDLTRPISSPAFRLHVQSVIPTAQADVSAWSRTSVPNPPPPTTHILVFDLPPRRRRGWWASPHDRIFDPYYYYFCGMAAGYCFILPGNN